MSKKRLLNQKRMTYNGDGDITKPNPYLNAAIIEAVDNQLRDNTPPATNETYTRLQRDGYSKEQAKEMIAAVLVEDIFNAIKYQKPHDPNDYESRLRALK